MLAFTLSKFSLVVMVVAVASIIGFFAMHLGESMTGMAVTSMLENYSLVASEMLSSPSYCDSIRLKIPDTIKLSGTELYYIMKISVLDAGDGQSYVIFSSAERRFPEQLIASSSLISNAGVKLFRRSGGRFVESDSMLLDPLARTDSEDRANAFYLVKELDSGDVGLYIFPCTISFGQTGDCERAKAEVGKIVNRDLGGFKCG